MESIKIFLILLLSSMSVQSKVNEKINGFWRSEIFNNNWSSEIIFYFNTDSSSIPLCEIHSFDNHVKFSSIKTENLVLNYPSISMITNENAKIKYTGVFNENNGTLTGKLIYEDGTSREMNFTKLSMEEVRTEHPGLFNIGKRDDKYQIPKMNDSSWKITELSEDEFNIDLIEKMLEKVYAGEIGSVHSILIVKNGNLVFEEYFDGFGWNDLHEMRSCTKSISSLLTGIMIDKNYIGSVENKLSDFIPNDYKFNKEAWSGVSLENVLTMSVGLDWDETEHEMIWNNSNDIVQSALNQSFKFNPGEKWEYRNPNVDLLAPVIINCTGMSVQNFADKFLFSPLNIKNYYWNNFKDTNYPLLDGSLAMTPREMAKIGQLILNKGVWNGKRIISEEWIEKSTKPYYKVDNIFDYAYLWWLGKSSSREGVSCIMAHGIGGQHIITFPSLDLVVVTTGGNYNDVMSIGLLSLIDNYIIKAVLK